MIYDTTFVTDTSFDTSIEKVDVIHVKDYNNLDNLPSIEGKVLKGNVALEEIGVDYLSNSELELLLK